MKKYIITFSYSINLEAKNEKEAEEIASEKWNNRKTPYAEEMNVIVDEGKF